ncbi:cyclin-T [Anthonomus grandis grandis]|uniref:cyclin-T n=1 Tax=Anthonomus grandis grandis TaxID=2921223 RepID=UPI002165070D|nr:cyclin-T [Anthonomus grandis grandis]
MANPSNNNDKWYFTKEQLENTPSRKCGFDAYKELQYRQQAANFIQDMGQRLQVSQLCINTAIVYMHRFYVFHSFTNFPWHQMAAAALFLAAKVEEQPRKLEYVIKVAHICKNPKDRSFDVNSERYIAQSQDLVFNENVLLQTLGFTVAIDHPHTYVVKCCHLVRASKDLAQTSYFMASNSLHLTTMCIQYKPTVVACFCILLACKWSNWEIPLSTEKKEWFTYVDQTVTAELLQQLTSEFLEIFENCPSRLKEKIMAKQEQEKRPEGSTPQRSLEYKGEDPHKHRTTRPPEAPSSGSSHRSQEQRDREYKERKEKERMAHMSGITLPNHHHHRPSGTADPKMKPHSRPSGGGNPPYPPPRDILRETKDSPFGIPGLHKDPYAAARVSDSKVKNEIKTEPMNSLTNYRVDPSRTRVDPPKPSSSSSSSSSSSTSKQQDMLRRYEEQQKQQQQQKQPSFKPSTSQKVSSSLVDNKQQSVPTTKPTVNHIPQYNNSKQLTNGNTNGSYNNGKPEMKSEPVKEEIPTPAVIKRPSLFSPEPEPAAVEVKNEPVLTKEPSLTSLTILSPINSPPSVRNRNYSSSSEPELRPTMKKIDQVEGFENLMRDSTIGMTRVQNDTSDSAPVQQGQELTHLEANSDIKTERSSPIKDPPPVTSTLVNGLETNPTLISNLLKEASTMSGVSVVKTESVETATKAPEFTEKEHKHHKSKKKKDKHRHRSKEEKEKKKKHKEKDREKHRHRERKEEVIAPLPSVSEPIKIKIQKDKIQPVNELKIKIPKDKIKTEGIVDSLSMSQPSSGGLKIKIPKDIIANCNTSGSSLSSLDISMGGQNSSSRKRDRDRTTSPMDTPPTKMSKSSHKDKQNGRHSSSYSKVMSQGDGESSVLRLAESKYTKGSS